MTARAESYKTLVLNTLAFTICFMCWTLNGVLVTYLTDTGIFHWSSVQIGWLFGIPILSGSVFRLPVGMLTDKFGGKWVFSILLLLCSLPMFFVSFADSFWMFAVLSFLWGLVGTGFAVGIAFTSVWFPKSKQGTALGIFGAGNAGSAITTLVAPTLLKHFTDDGTYPDGWKWLPVIYAAALFTMGLLFILFTKNKKPEKGPVKNLREEMAPLKSARVWRFGLYYLLVFGCFVAFAQWLVPYYVSVYAMPLVTAGLLASVFSLPSGVIRALGGWMSDKWGARKVMYWVLGLSIALSALLIFPKMEIYSPGFGVISNSKGVVTSISENEITVGNEKYEYTKKPEETTAMKDGRVLVLPTIDSWQDAVVKTGEEVKRKQLLAQGQTRIFFQANVWIFTVIVMMIGIAWGIGKAAVYKFIPEYFPNQVGVVGGMVGVIGGLGGFLCPIIFGYLLQATGLWTSSWMFICFLSVTCFYLLTRTVSKMMNNRSPELVQKIEFAD